MFCRDCTPPLGTPVTTNAGSDYHLLSGNPKSTTNLLFLLFCLISSITIHLSPIFWTLFFSNSFALPCILLSHKYFCHQHPFYQWYPNFSFFFFIYIRCTLNFYPTLLKTVVSLFLLSSLSVFEYSPTLISRCWNSYCFWSQCQLFPDTCCRGSHYSASQGRHQILCESHNHPHPISHLDAALHTL